MRRYSIIPAGTRVVCIRSEKSKLEAMNGRQTTLEICHRCELEMASFLRKIIRSFCRPLLAGIYVGRQAGRYLRISIFGNTQRVPFYCSSRQPKSHLKWCPLKMGQEESCRIALTLFDIEGRKYWGGLRVPTICFGER